MSCQINNTSNFDTTEIDDLIQDLFTFSRKRFGFKNPPVLNLVSDKNNTSPLGKTAHYDPSNMSITIYVDGRHPKDIMRSFSHELVHHRQNENGMFNNIGKETGDGYAQSNPHLRKMEKEAYLQGNMCFRDWEDGYKSSNPNILNERRIYKMSTKKWLNKELNGLLNEKWGFSMDLNKLNENNKPDYIDIDGDGDKEESMKDAAKDKKEGSSDKPKKGEVPEQFRKEKVNEEDMGDNPEGVTELMDAINGLSEKESEQVYKMLLKKHGKEDKKHSPMDMKERKLRESIRNIIKSQLKKRK